MLKGLGIGAVLGAIALIIVYGIVRRMERTLWLWGAVVSLAFLAFIAAIAPVFIAPVFNTISRVAEAEADIFGLNAARQPDGMAEATMLLAEYRKVEPSRCEEWLFYDHPSGHSRIAMAMRWKAENLIDAGVEEVAR